MLHRRVTHRRRSHVRRRRRNPAMGGLMRGLPLPRPMEAVGGIGGFVGSRWAVKSFLPQATGWMHPLAILGAGIAGGFVLKMLKQPTLANAFVMGGTIAAGYEAVKLTPLAAQLGEYYVPSGFTPVVSGVGALPSGFMNQTDIADAEQQFLAEENL